MPPSPNHLVNILKPGGPATVDLPPAPPRHPNVSPADGLARNHPSYEVLICTGRPIPVRSAVASISVTCGTLQSRP